MSSSINPRASGSQEQAALPLPVVWLVGKPARRDRGVDLVNCPECDALLEVVDLRPPTLDYASSQDGDDDWDDDDWEED